MSTIGAIYDTTVSLPYVISSVFRLISLFWPFLSCNGGTHQGKLSRLSVIMYRRVFGGALNLKRWKME